jgi:hypothetical protein
MWDRWRWIVNYQRITAIIRVPDAAASAAFDLIKKQVDSICSLYGGDVVDIDQRVDLSSQQHSNGVSEAIAGFAGMADEVLD